MHDIVTAVAQQQAGLQGTAYEMQLEQRQQQQRTSLQRQKQLTADLLRGVVTVSTALAFA